MSREIKFRQPIFLNGKFNRWHYWGFISSQEFVGPVPPLDKAYETSQQYTGIKDQNGREIWEGDVVSASIYSDEEPSILEVVFEDGCFVIYYRDAETDVVPIGWFVGSLEIIGNIHENKELIEGGE